MELPVGKIAEDLITELEDEIRTRQREIEQYRGSIEGIKHFVSILKERAQATVSGSLDSRQSPSVHPAHKVRETYRHPSSGAAESQAAVATGNQQAQSS